MAKDMASDTEGQPAPLVLLLSDIRCYNFSIKLKIFCRVHLRALNLCMTKYLLISYVPNVRVVTHY